NPVSAPPPRGWGRPCPRRDRIAHAGDERVVHHDFADQPQRRAVHQTDVDAGDRRPITDETSLYLFVARAAHLPRVAVAVVEAPGATLIRRQCYGMRDARAMLT